MHHRQRSNIVNKYVQLEAEEAKPSPQTQRFDDLQDTSSEEDDNNSEFESQSEEENDDEQPNTDDEAFIDDSDVLPQPDSRAYIDLH